MGKNTIYIVFGIVAVIYLIILMTNRRQSKSRKSRKFMEDYNSSRKRNDMDKKEE